MKSKDNKTQIVLGFDMETDVGSWTPYYEGMVHGTPAILSLLEQHDLTATFFFTVMNYAVQMWPWVIVALCAITLYGRELADPEMTYVWMMGRWLPHGILGIMMVSLIAAFMSTISTHLNLGGSYMINRMGPAHEYWETLRHVPP